jgi:hypothetical protein
MTDTIDVVAADPVEDFECDAAGVLVCRSIPLLLFKCVDMVSPSIIVAAKKPKRAEFSASLVRKKWPLF